MSRLFTTGIRRASTSTPAASNCAMYDIFDNYTVKELSVLGLKFTVPLNYENPQDNRYISVAARLVRKRSDTPQPHQGLTLDAKKLFVYLQGGPGFPCFPPLSNSGYTRELISRGCDVLFVDQRGTGLSTPLTTQQLTEMGDSDKQLEYVKHFRADSIVQDCEHIRKCLIGTGKWSLLGQSFGGFCAFTYLSLFPSSLARVLVTGGIPPIDQPIEKVYTQTYKRLAERNRNHYQKYPEDVPRVKKILNYLSEHPTALPDGGILSPERFQGLGMLLGRTGGSDTLHQLTTKFWDEIQDGHPPTYSTLAAIRDQSSFDTNIIYAILHEAIYCSSGMSSRWAAERLRRELPFCQVFNLSSFSDAHSSQDLSDVPVYFTGEMIYKSMFEDYSELRPMKELAEKLAEYSEWTDLYDVAQLQKITNTLVATPADKQTPEPVPTYDTEKAPVIAAATYIDDMFVDFELSNATVNLIQDYGVTVDDAAAGSFSGAVPWLECRGQKNTVRRYVTNQFFHNGLGANPGDVVGHLFDLIENTIE